MDLLYYKINPTGNITLIVETPVPRESQAAVSTTLMELDEAAEQVGFIEKADSSDAALRLQMMGGEFCGNATLSAAALAKMLELPGTEGDAVTLEISGAEKPLTVLVKQNGERDFCGTVSMPLPESCFTAQLRFEDFICDLPVVRFHGISHVIIDSESIRRYNFNVRRAEAVIEDWCRQLGSDALGLMFWDKADGLLNPYVYVSTTGTAVWESSCASGSTAVAIYLAVTAGQNKSVSLLQPGGRISVEVDCKHGIISDIRLSGNANITSRYSVSI
ncbi:MAG: hypothetical protein Q4A83_00465 [Bacillota bacterium]|nr:hypothetical protein [Bacillota bacterium]